MFLDRFASHAERSGYEAVRACEAFAFPGAKPVLARVAPASRFPSLEQEAKLLAAVLPGGRDAVGWSGIAALCLLGNWGFGALRRQLERGTHAAA